MPRAAQAGARTGSRVATHPVASTVARATARTLTSALVVGALVVGAVQLTSTPAVAAHGVAAPNVAAPDVEVVDVALTGSGDVSSGFATLRIDVALRSTAGLPDVLLGGSEGGHTDMVDAARVDGTPAWVEPGETLPAWIGWLELTRVSGTAHDGVWRGTTTVSRIHGSTWLVTQLYDGSPDGWTDLTDLDLTFTVHDGAPPPWAAVPAPAGPVHVVSGAESWTPRARLTSRASGAGIAGFWLPYNFYAEPTARPAVRLPADATLARADAQGYLTLPARRVVSADGEPNREVIHAYAKRGTRGYSWEAATTLWPTVKWQASQEISASGRTVVAIGKAWPAPSIYAAVNRNVHLQQLVGRTWRTVATARVRDNGRYTVEWSAPTAGNQVMRVYKPGGSELGGVRRSVGTTLAAVTVTTR